jgi:hypothetical protein
LEITFRTAELRDLCEKREVASAAMGYEAARELEQRLADIDAVDTVEELVLLLGPSVVDSSPSEKRIQLPSDYCICFGSAHPKDSGVQQGTDWGNTSRVKILGIEKIDG